MKKQLNNVFIVTAIIAMMTVILSCSETGRLHALTPNATILAFGDSLTHGIGTRRDNAYPAVLAQRINHEVINAGVPGEISARGLLRLPALITKYQPELIIICHGGNDILRKLDLNKTRDNIQKMIDLAHANNSQVLLIGVPEFGLFLSPSPIYQALADENKIPVANDILADILRDNRLKSDHVHPNASGYQRLAEHLADFLEKNGALID